jgi:hypothetical protein
MKASMTSLFLAVILAAGCSGINAESKANAGNGASITLVPYSSTFDRETVEQGSVGFTAVIRNQSAETIKIAYPSVCLPADYTQGEARRISDLHGKSEILLIITKPDGIRVTLRAGYLHYFDPDNAPLLTIPPNRTGTFSVGWFFRNERGSWERDDEAAKVFLSKGKYRVRILFRNALPLAALYDVTAKKYDLVDVWTGEMESPEITIEVK